MTAVRLALANNQAARALGRWLGQGGARPSVLLSYAYLAAKTGDEWQRLGREWVLDSGAFTAFMGGKPIGLAAYIDFCKRVADSPHPPAEVFALDVIGDWRASVRNAEAMAAAGVAAIPTYHYGSPPEVLTGLARDYPKIAIGLGSGRRLGHAARLAWLSGCMGRVWPAKVHAFAISDLRSCLALPFHTVDASTWDLAPSLYKRWTGFSRSGVGQVRVPAPRDADLGVQIKHFLELEARLRAAWRRAFAAAGIAPA